MYTLHQHVVRGHLRLTGFRSRYVDTSVGRMHAVEAKGGGAHPPVVLLHGLSASGVHFSALLRRLLPQVTRAVAPDMPGHGFSDVPEGGLQSKSLRSGTFEALDALIDDPVVLFGSSMGGLAAVRYALSRPERVRGLVLCSPGGAPVAAHERDDFLDTFRIDTHKKAEIFVERFLAEPPVWKPVLAWGVRKSLGHPEVQALLQELDSNDMLHPDELRGLTMPILLLWGQAEGILPPSHFSFYAQHLPKHALIERPPHYGHTPYLEYPDCVTRKMLAFIEQV